MSGSSRIGCGALLTGMAFSLVPSPGVCQTTQPTDFSARAIEHATRFSDLDVAIREGYRKLGPDFPGMGEHWINPSLVIGGKLDPAWPPVLCYIPTDSGRRFVGFAFTQVLAPGEAPSDSPFPALAWHDHTSGVDEEALLLASPASMNAGPEGFRLAMVHVWNPVANADGLLAQNNWRLPFLRAGLPFPEHTSLAAARALSLAGEGLSFYRRLLIAGLGLEGKELATAEAAFAEAAETVDRWLAPRRETAHVESVSISELERIWSALWRRLEGDLSPGTFEALHILDSSAQRHRPAGG